MAGPSGAPLRLAVIGAEQVVLDPHNRDAVLSPTRFGAELPRAPDLCTAYVLEVTRAAEGSAPLSYSLPVRFSRFERLQAELLSELPSLRESLPPLPSKRGPLSLDRLLQWGAAPAERIEERTRALDTWVRTLVDLPGAVQSRALGDLIFLGVGAESAIRGARDASEAQAATHSSQIYELTARLKTADAYARACRERKDRADERASHLSSALDASCRLLSARRDAAAARRAWAIWARAASLARDRRAAKAAAAGAAALSAGESALRMAEERRRAAEARAAGSDAKLASMVREMGCCDAELSALRARVSASQLALEATVRSHVAASHVAAREAHEAIDVLSRRADASERAALSRLITSCRLAAERAALLSALRDSDLQMAGAAAELARVRVDVAQAAAAADAAREVAQSERRARVVAGVARAVAAAATEPRLLLLLRSQRERIASMAAELAEVRMAAAVAHGRPEMEAPWLAQGDPDGAEGDELRPATVSTDEGLARRELLERCRIDWLGAIALAI